MMLALRFEVGIMRCLWVVKAAEVLEFAIDANMCLPFCLKPAHARIARRIVSLLSSVLDVLRISCFAQISKPIVGALAIDVVDLIGRPFTSHVQPREPVNSVADAVEIASYVACRFIEPASDRPGWFSTTTCLKAREHPSFWIVVKQLTQTFCGYNGLSHEVPVKLIDQRPASIGSASRAFAF